MCACDTLLTSTTKCVCVSMHSFPRLIITIFVVVDVENVVAFVQKHVKAVSCTMYSQFEKKYKCCE